MAKVSCSCVKVPACEYIYAALEVKVCRTESAEGSKPKKVSETFTLIVDCPRAEAVTKIQEYVDKLENEGWVIKKCELHVYSKRAPT